MKEKLNLGMEGPKRRKRNRRFTASHEAPSIPRGVLSRQVRKARFDTLGFGDRINWRRVNLRKLYKEARRSANNTP